MDYTSLSPYVIRYFKVVVLYLLQNFGEEVRGDELHDILREIDTNMNGQVELDEYLQVLCAAATNEIF